MATTVGALPATNGINGHSDAYAADSPSTPLDVKIDIDRIPDAAESDVRNAPPAVKVVINANPNGDEAQLQSASVLPEVGTPVHPGEHCFVCCTMDGALTRSMQTPFPSIRPRAPRPRRWENCYPTSRWLSKRWI